MRLTPLLAALLLIAPLDGAACSWEGISEGNVARVLPDRVRDADAVVHGKVTSLKVTGADEVAEIKVLRSYKGSAATFTVRSQTCAVTRSLSVRSKSFLSIKVGLAFRELSPLQAGC
jgi:hypothetical protein